MEQALTSGPDFRLDSAAVIQLLGDPEFYPQNLWALFLREQALAATEQYRNAVAERTRNPDCCTGRQDDRQLVEPVLAMFVRTVLQVAEFAGPEGLQGLRDYIAQKLGYSPRQIRLAYLGGRTKIQQELRI